MEYSLEDELALSDYDNLTSSELEALYRRIHSTVPIHTKNLSQVEIGIIHLTLSVSFFIFQFLIFTSFYNKKELLKNTCFFIIFHHGLLSCIQQICHIVTAILTILRMKNIETLFVVVGALLTSTYINSVLLILILTINRFVIVFNINIFDEEQKRKFYYIVIIILYTMVIGLFVLYFHPTFKVTFNFEEYQWQYIKSGDGDIAFQIENKTILTSLGISFILQMCIIFKIFLLRCYTKRRITFAVEDFKIVIHAFLCFVTTLTLEFIWDGVFFEFEVNRIEKIVPQILYIFTSVSNSIFVLFFVKEIRINTIFFKFCQRRKNIKFRSVVKRIKTVYQTEKKIVLRMMSSTKSLSNLNNREYSFYQDKDLYLDLLNLRLTESKVTFNKGEQMTPLVLNAFCRAPVRPILRRSRIKPQNEFMRSRCLFQSSNIMPAVSGDAENVQKK
uniref:7TM_GPCR_Srx domain-containing protein n=1 Tax=Strongyloides venezuelensis TaxID=75913 RepID=A0A0K0G412_STRVS